MDQLQYLSEKKSPKINPQRYMLKTTKIEIFTVVPPHLWGIGSSIPTDTKI